MAKPDSRPRNPSAALKGQVSVSPQTFAQTPGRGGEDRNPSPPFQDGKQEWEAYGLSRRSIDDPASASSPR